MLVDDWNGFDEDSELTPSDQSNESNTCLNKQLQEYYLELTEDGRFVRWMRNNPKYPRNWTGLRKTYDTTVICLLDLFVTASSTAGAAAAGDARHEYHLAKTVSILCFVTLFPLGQCVGNIFLPPLSETFGRKNLYILSGVMSCICCTIIGLVHSFPVSVIMRLLGGTFSAVPGTIVGGSIEDMFNSQARIWVVFFWTIASNIGLMIGPVVSSYVVASLHWRWVFYIYAIIIGVITGLLFPILESRSSYLLVHEVNKLRPQIPHIRLL
ncbi:hypothetical protein N7470_002322 [Penicillium chermesinum]|nr:hypothetical protein N7470_002322 [Penicillium chermesinum]